MNSAPNFHSNQNPRYDNYTSGPSEMRISTEHTRTRTQGERSRYQQEPREWEDHDNRNNEEDQFYFQSVPNSHENSANKESARNALGKIASPSDFDPRKSKSSQRSLSGDSYSKLNAIKKGNLQKGITHLKEEKSTKPFSPGRSSGKMTPSSSVTRFSTAGFTTAQPDPTLLDVSINFLNLSYRVNFLILKVLHSQNHKENYMNILLMSQAQGTISLKRVFRR